MKILVVGGSGVIGFNLMRDFLGSGFGTSFTYLSNKTWVEGGVQLDVTKKEKTVELIKKINPEVVVHTTALTNVDLCETDKRLAYSINVEGTANVLEGCKQTNSKIVFVSTPFVYDGSKRVYCEEDPASPATYYGYTKMVGETMVKECRLPYLILRTDQPYCWIENWQHTNSVVRAIRTLKNKGKLREITDWYNNPTYVPEFASLTRRLIIDSQTGIFHLVGSDFISRYCWSLKVAEIFGFDKNNIVPIRSEELNLPARRPSVNLSNKKLFDKIGIHMMGVEQGASMMHNDNICNSD